MDQNETPSENPQLDDGPLEALKTELASQTERANRNEARLKDHLLNRGIERAAIRGKAYNAGQIVGLLKHRSELVPALDVNGKPLDDQFDVVVKAENGDALSLQDTLESLRKSDPYLFFSADDIRKSTAAKDGESNMQMMARLARESPAEYHRLRREHPELVGLRANRQQ